MDFHEEIKIKRFKIIEPFLKKEKKLKEIEMETGISYATLKRWIKSYKENGMLGLEKKEREDKNSFKAIDDEGLSLIKKFCSKDKESNISKLYENCQNFLKEKNYSISYPTFYRILNNIDGFFKKSMNYHLDKIKKSNEIFSIIEIPLSIFVQSSNKIVVPTLLLIFDLANLKVIHYTVNTEPTNIYSILGFIRESILKASVFYNHSLKPKEILIDSENTINKSLSKDIFDKTNIKISNYSNSDKNIQKFIELLDGDLNKVFFDRDKIFEKDELTRFLDQYLYLDNPQFNFQFEPNLLENRNFLRELDIFLQTTTRKVSASSFRLKNNIFKSNILEELEGIQVQLKFNPINYNIIYIFTKNKFYGLVKL